MSLGDLIRPKSPDVFGRRKMPDIEKESFPDPAPAALRQLADHLAEAVAEKNVAAPMTRREMLQAHFREIPYGEMMEMMEEVHALKSEDTPFGLANAFAKWSRS